jgi:hypothetical protein
MLGPFRCRLLVAGDEVDQLLSLQMYSQQQGIVGTVSPRFTSQNVDCLEWADEVELRPV